MVIEVRHGGGSGWMDGWVGGDVGVELHVWIMSGCGWRVVCGEGLLSKRLACCFLQLHFRDGWEVTLRVMSGCVDADVAVDESGRLLERGEGERREMRAEACAANGGVEED